MFLAYPGEYGYEIRPLISVGYISILKRLEMDCGAMMRFDIKGGDRLPLPVRERTDFDKGSPVELETVLCHYAGWLRSRCRIGSVRSIALY